MNDIAKRQFSLLPGSLGEARELAIMIAGSEFAPKDYKNKPDSVLIAVQMGADLGLSPMQSLQNIAVINGRPSIWGDAALALVMPALERFQETLEGEAGTDAYAAVCLARRKGWPDDTIRRFSVADARKANLWGKAGPWTNYPNRMLQLRARGFCLRDVGADRLLGFILAEEAMDLPTEIPIGGGQTEQAKALTVFETLPEPLRDTVEKAFQTLSFSPAQRLQKLNEYLGAEGIVAEEAASALLEWCRDEYARRKTGQARGKKDENRKRSGVSSGSPASHDQPEHASASGSELVGESKTPVITAEDIF